MDEDGMVNEHGVGAARSSEPFDDEESKTEQVTAELLAASVSKMSLAREVLRLKQLRDELLATATASNNNLSALRERQHALETEIRAEEEASDKETVLLAEQVAQARDELLALQLENSRLMEDEDAEGRESGEARALLTARTEGTEMTTGTEWTAGSIDITKETAIRNSGLKSEIRYDCKFVQKVLECKKRLAETSIEYATPLEKSSGHVKGFLKNSKYRIQILLDRIDTIAPQRPIHDHVLALLRENAHLRISVNEYTEGLLAETFMLLDNAPMSAVTPR